jgi:hypothetical protein
MSSIKTLSNLDKAWQVAYLQDKPMKKSWFTYDIVQVLPHAWGGKVTRHVVKFYQYTF